MAEAPLASRGRHPSVPGAPVAGGRLRHGIRPASAGIRRGQRVRVQEIARLRRRGLPRPGGAQARDRGAARMTAPAENAAENAAGTAAGTEEPLIGDAALALVGQEISRSAGTVVKKEFQRWAAAVGDPDTLYFHED